MIAKSKVNGHEVYFDEKDGKWYFQETGHIINHEAACSECGKTHYRFQVFGKEIAVDYCIGSIVEALNKGGVVTNAACCGHGEMPGVITLEDGRELAVFKAGEMSKLLSVFNARTIYGERTPKK